VLSFRLDRIDNRQSIDVLIPHAIRGSCSLESSTFVSKWIGHAVDGGQVNPAAPVCRSGPAQVKRNQQQHDISLRSGQ
jgi:hypothetical protein